MSEYDEFVAFLPQVAQADLMSSEAACTAFWLAHRAGWGVETLGHNAMFQYRRTNSIGIVISGLRGLAEHPPPSAQATKADPNKWVPDKRERLDPALIPERVQALHGAVDGTVDDAESAMREVIKRQRGT